jgi:hypothetical protein
VTILAQATPRIGFVPSRPVPRNWLRSVATRSSELASFRCGLFLGIGFVPSRPVPRNWLRSVATPFGAFRTRPEKTNPTRREAGRSRSIDMAWKRRTQFRPPDHLDLDRPIDQHEANPRSPTRRKDEANRKDPDIPPTVGSPEGWPEAASISASPNQEDRSGAVRLTHSLRPATEFRPLRGRPVVGSARRTRQETGR